MERDIFGNPPSIFDIDKKICESSNIRTRKDFRNAVTKMVLNGIVNTIKEPFVKKSKHKPRNSPLDPANLRGVAGKGSSSSGVCNYGTFWEHPVVCVDIPVAPSGAVITSFW
jgi:hypothetical protein